MAQADGQRRRLVIEEWTRPEERPWEIPEAVEEREQQRKDFLESQLYKCNHPEDTEYGDIKKHLFGTTHLSREMVVRKYAEYSLKPVGVLSIQEWPPSEEPTHTVISPYSAAPDDTRNKRTVLAVALVVSLTVVVVAVLRLLNLL